MKQKVAYKKTLENNGVVSKSMLEAGYSKNMAKNPQSLTRSKGWKELMGNKLSDDVLFKKHLQLLNKEEVIIKNNVTSGEIDVIPTGQIDTQAVKAGLDMAYKLKGYYTVDPTPNQVNFVNINLFDNPDVKNALEGFKNVMVKKLYEPKENNKIVEIEQTES